MNNYRIVTDEQARGVDREYRVFLPEHGLTTGRCICRIRRAETDTYGLHVERVCAFSGTGGGIGSAGCVVITTQVLSTLQYVCCVVPLQDAACDFCCPIRVKLDLSDGSREAQVNVGPSSRHHWATQEIPQN